MEANPSIEFDCYLAEKLGMHLSEVRSMPNDDYMTLQMYYQRKAMNQEIELKKAEQRRR